MVGCRTLGRGRSGLDRDFGGVFGLEEVPGVLQVGAEQPLVEPRDDGFHDAVQQGVAVLELTVVVDAGPGLGLDEPVLDLLFDGQEHRVTWDYPITSVESIEQLPFEPERLNIKPSRFSTVESVLDTIEYCLEQDIQMYGGGQTELSVGREHIHALASLF